MTNRRRFNRSERIDLYLAAGGRCTACGLTLPAGWHADHVTPYALGGATDAVNGQALCPACNLRKGVGVPMTEHWPENFQLRKWQRIAHQEYVEQKRDNFLCVATPGAGKTSWALYVASRSLILGETTRIVVVVPTDHLRRQWLDKAAEFGIQLDDAFTNQMRGGEAHDFDGVVVTYAQVASSPTLHRALCGQRPTFVIFDEIHHAGSGLHWGEKIKEAFEPAKRRLAMTGTPFRSDNNQIPFVEYGLDGKSVAHFSYGYGPAVTDGVCRGVYFPSYEGRLRWWSERDGEIVATFRDELTEDAGRRRLDTALDPNGEWLRTVLAEADAKLLSVRENVFADAAGLVIAKDQHHARAICDLLRAISGEDPALAISDDENASRIIGDFARVPSPDAFLAAPPKRWIVAVKMVSEGVDIPRLFVGVYATNVTTELYFRQAVGRFVRRMDDVSGQVAFVFIPRVASLVAFAQAIKEEREHAITASEEDEERTEKERQQRLLDAERVASTFTPLSGSALPDDVFFDGSAYSQGEISEARGMIARAGLDWERMSDIEVARLARVMRESMVGVAVPQVRDAPEAKARPLRLVKDDLRRDVKALTSRLVGLAGRDYMRNAFDFSLAYRLLNHATQTNQEGATEEQLHRRKAVLKGWIELAKAADTPLSEIEWWEQANDARRQTA